LAAGAPRLAGAVVRAFNTTKMIDRIAAAHGRKLIECSIGFKYIADLMMEQEILIGGEESGGIGYSRTFPNGTDPELPAARECDGEEGKTLGSWSRACKRILASTTMDGGTCIFRTK